MSEVSQLNISVEIGNSRKTKMSKMITLDKVIEWIKKHGFDDYTTKNLITIASRYPTQALSSFQKNFNLMLQRARK